MYGLTPKFIFFANCPEDHISRKAIETMQYFLYDTVSSRHRPEDHISRKAIETSPVCPHSNPRASPCRPEDHISRKAIETPSAIPASKPASYAEVPKTISAERQLRLLYLHPSVEHQPLGDPKTISAER